MQYEEDEKCRQLAKMLYWFIVVAGGVVALIVAVWLLAA
jgi:hypothetical protein